MGSCQSDAQVVCCERTRLLAAKPVAKKVLREYQRVHALAHSGPKGEQHRVYYRAGPTHGALDTHAPLGGPAGGTTVHTVYWHPSTNRCPPPHIVQEEVLQHTVY